MEKNTKNQTTLPVKTSVSKFKNSLSFSSSSNRKFTYLGKDSSKIAYDLDKSNSNSSINGSELKGSTVKYNFVHDPIAELSKVNNVIIKVEYENCCCINQTNNLYNVFTKNKNNVKYIFRAEELMPCTDYSCCEYMSKPFSLNIEHVVSIGTEINTKEFATTTRNFSIPCLCFCRHELKVKFHESQNICGKIVLPFSFGDKKYKIYNGMNKLIYTVDTEYCQAGILCTKNCCGYLPDVIFDIFNDKKENVGTIERKPGAFEQFMHVLDCYQIFFPKGASYQEKFLLICSVFMIESEIFRDKWGSLEYCECGDCGEDCCMDCSHRCCAEFFSGFFRF